MGYTNIPNYTGSSLTPNSATGAALAALGTYWFVMVILYVLIIVADWKIFTKAGEKGWKSIIPVYNLVVLYKISGLSPWLVFLYAACFIPILGIVCAIAIGIVSIIQKVKICQAFGKGTGFIIGMIFFPLIFDLILGLGSSKYQAEAKAQEVK